MKTFKLWNMGFAVLTLLAAGCGTGLGPVETATGNGSFPQLGSISTGNPGGNLTGVFTPTAPYWVFNNLFSFGGNYLSPADGIVIQIGTTTIAGTGTNFVTILHTGGRVASRFIGVQQVVVRVGDTVVAGQPVGTFFNSNGVTFQVLVDGNPVCPLSFMSDTFRANFTGFSFNPCQ